MDGFDDPGVYFSDTLSNIQEDEREVAKMNLVQMERRFKNFIKTFHDGNLIPKYR